MEKTHECDAQGLTELRAELEALRLRVAALESSRRRIQARSALVVGSSLVFLAVLTRCIPTQVADAHLDDPTGVALQQYMDYSNPHIPPPALDTMVRWQRRDPEDKEGYYTNEIISLVSDNDQQNSFAWPLYIELRGTNHPAATLDTSQSAGSTVRAFNRSTGSPWLAGYHSELHHGRDGVDGSVVEANGTSILYNAELNTFSKSGTTIGLLLMNTPNSTTLGSRASEIASTSAGWFDGILFTGSGIAGNIGINFGDARYNMGLDLANNDMRLNCNQRVILERNGTVYLRFNCDTAAIELVKFDKVVASW